MISIASRRCSVCEERKVEHLHWQRFILPEGHPLAGGYSVVSCRSCGFVYADIAATQDDYDRFYAKLSKYDDSASSTGSGETAIDYERLEGTAEILTPYIASEDSRILDIGCAGGGLLAALKRRQYHNLVGLDPSEGCVHHTQSKEIAARQGWLSNLPPDLGTFDCITLSHVLEHVLDVPDAISNIAPLLRPGGFLYVEVPDAARYADHVYAPFQDFNTEHINHFSGKCLDNALARHGYSSIACGGRLLRPSAHTFTPSIYSMYQRVPHTPELSPDKELKTSIYRYIERSATMLANIGTSIDEALRESPELIVWGAGQLALKLLAETSLSRAKLIAFVDSNPIHHGHKLAGVPIVSPDSVRDYPQPILIATLLHQREIQERAIRLGLTNRIILLPEREGAALLQNNLA